MEIQYVYSKRRSEFGRQCNFYDRPVEVHCNIPADEEVSAKFISRNPVDNEIQCDQQLAEHEVRKVLMC